jgi:LysM repeat protein
LETSIKEENMKTEKRFEGIDLIKLCVLLVLVLVPVILYLGSANQQSEAARNEEIVLEPGMGSESVPSDGSDSQSKQPDSSVDEGEESSGTTDESSTNETSVENQQDGTGNFGDRVEAGKEESSEGTSEGDPEDSTSMDQSGEVGSESSALTPGQFPPPPVSGEALFLNEDEGILYTPTGQIVYELDETGEVWVPVVPGEVSDATGEAEPEMSDSGYWVLVDDNGEVAYIWEPGRLVWRSYDGSQIVAIPPTEGILEGETATSEAGGETGNEVSEGENSSGSGETGSTGSETSGSSGTDSGTSSSGSEGTGSSTTTEGTGNETGGSTTEGEDASGSVSNESNVPLQVPEVEIPPEVEIVPKVHSIHTGEFIYCLGRRFDVSPYDILRANGLYGSWIVPAGQKITIPQNGDPFPAERALKLHPVMHTVQQAETIYTIACQYGDVFPEAIIYANNLVAPYILTPGTQIIIP